MFIIWSAEPFVEVFDLGKLLLSLCRRELSSTIRAYVELGDSFGS